MLPEVKNFLRSKETLLTIKHQGRKQPGLSYTDYYSVISNAFTYICFQILRHFPCGEMKNSLYRLFGVKIGKEVLIGVDVMIDPFYPSQISIMDGAAIGWGARILAHESTMTHFRIGKVTIGKKSMVGSFSTVRSGITIGNNATIAMCSFVNKDVPDNGFVGGVPARGIVKHKA
ncbi:MAG: acyltransferase [Nanoarchaeota archaeon]|nr:acyltransferase [Nanoarchaeota archaeon]